MKMNLKLTFIRLTVKGIYWSVKNVHTHVYREEWGRERKTFGRFKLVNSVSRR